PPADAAEDAGLAVGTVGDATRGAQVVAILVPDHVQKGVYEQEVEPNLAADAALLFAHGLNVHFGRIAPPPGHDVVMVAPKAPGHRVRELYESGAGTPGLVAVHQDASGHALELALAYGTAIGCARWRASKASSARRPMASVDVPVALLGYGTVGAAVNRLLVENADEIERATGHRLRVTRALVRDLEKERTFPAADGILTNDFR